MDNPDSARPEWQQLELLVAAIQKQLAPGAKVTHNAKIYGKKSQATRQVDVLVEQQVGQYQIRIALDCKDYAVPVDVNGVGEFHTLIQDIGVHKGALVCPAGFTKTAKTLARELQIDLYSPVDTDPHKWQVHLAVPVLCNFRSMRISFGISCSAPVPLRIPDRFFELPIFDERNQRLSTIYETAAKKWDNGEFPILPGQHEKLALLPSAVTKIDNGYGMLVPVDLFVSLTVSRQLYIGHVPIESLRGLKDEQTGLVITNAFTLGALDPIAVQSEWRKIEENEELPFKPVMSVQGLYCWGTE